MPKLYNTVMGTYMNMPAHYVGVFPFVEAAEEEVAPPIQENLEGYKPEAIDGDNDGLVQDGTDFQRPADTELTVEEQVAAVKKRSNKKSK